MHFQRVAGDHAPQNVYRSVVNSTSAAGAVAIVAGDVLMWDIIDNSAETGIMTDTRGARVLKTVTNSVTSNFHARVAGVAETSAPITNANQFKNDGFIMQVSGFHPAVRATGTTHTQYRNAVISNVAGSVIQSSALPLTSVVEGLGSIGWYPATVGSTPATVPVMLRGLL